VGLIFALAFVFWIAFKVIMGVDLPNYSVYLVAGLFPWAWLSMGVVSASRSFVAHGALIREMGLAHAILPLSNVVQELMHFTLALPLIVAWIAIPGDYPPHWSWLWQIPLLMALQVLFVYPLALAAALVNAYVRDLESWLATGFVLLFFATPMAYPVSMVPEGLARWFELNPFHALMECWRAVFIESRLDGPHAAYAAGFAAAAGIVVWLLYRRLAPRVGEVV
jgi:lipopolysaccharide transport system permease protein